MIDFPLISVLLPVYNAAPFLSDCVESIIQQSEKRWELLAVDDFSTDQSADILRHFEKRDGRIRLFHSNSKGIIPALRLALQKSKGSFVTRMDADDIMDHQKLAALLAPLQQQGRGYLSTGLVRYFAEGQLGQGYSQYENWLNQLCRNRNHYQDIYRECVIPSPCWMTHREDLNACRAFWSDTYPEDYDLCFRFYKYGLRILTVERVLHYWRDHAQRTSRTNPLYSDQHYFDLKMNYYLDLEYEKNRPLVLWGAGKKGKTLARKLVDAEVSFYWVSNNARKNGKVIFGKTLSTFQSILTFEGSPKLIIAVASPADQHNIKAFLKRNNFKPKEDFFFFC